jgi:hypothetical protein
MGIQRRQKSGDTDPAVTEETNEDRAADETRKALLVERTDA